MARRRPRDSGESDDSEQEEERSSEDESDGSYESGSDSDGSDDSASGEEEGDSEEEEDGDEDEDVAKLARVARDVERMRAMCAEMDKMKLRLQFRLDAAREAKQEALQRQADQREQSERRQASAADFDAPQPAVWSVSAPIGTEQPPVTPDEAVKTDACVQTDCDMAEMNRMEASCRVMPAPSDRSASISLSKSNVCPTDQDVVESGRRTPVSVDERSPALSIFDLDKSAGVDGRGATIAESAFYDRILSGVSSPKKLGAIPSVSSESEQSDARPSWPSTSGRQLSEKRFTVPTAKSSFDSRPTTRVSRDGAGTDTASGHDVFNAQDTLRAPLPSPSLENLTVSTGKTDEQREHEAIQSLLFGR